MKQITLDYDLYKKELTEAAIYGSKLTTDIIVNIEQCLSSLNSYSSLEQYDMSKNKLRILLRDLKTYGETK